MLWAVLAGVGFFALVMASIALHEVGHLVPAKLFGVKVTQYFVGFGRTLWSRTWRGTEYGLKLLPLGGYVRLIGMYPPARPGHRPGSRLQRLADEARAIEYETITEADDGRLLHQKPVWQRIIVMAGGPLMNLLLAFCILWGVNALHGQWRPQPVVGTVVSCVVPSDQARRTCTDADPAAPASAAGLRPGDRITTFNDTPIDDWAQLNELIRANKDGEVRLVVERDGQRVELAPTHTVLNHVRDRLDPGRLVEAGFLGMTPAVELRRGGPLTTAGDLWLQGRQSVVALGQFPVKVFHVTVDLVTGQQRDATGPVSVVGASRAAGEIASDERLDLGDRFASWFAMLASVNLFVFLLNLVPLPPLDGGHIMAAAFDGLRRLWARLRGRAAPPAFDTAQLLPVAYLVGAFLLLAGAVLVIADVISPVRLI